MKKKEKNKNFALSGHFGENNMGDDALLVSLIEGLRSIHATGIVVFSANPTNTHRMLQRENAWDEDIEILYNGRWGLSEPGKPPPASFAWMFETMQVLHKASLHLIGPGTIVKDNTNPFFLLFWLARACMSIVMNRCFGFIGIGVGKVSYLHSRIAFRVIGNIAKFITVRDEISAEELRKLGIDKPKTIMVCPDLTFLESSDTTLPSSRPQHRADIHRIGINFRDFGKKHFPARILDIYESSIIEFINQLPNYTEVLFFSFCDEPHQSDSVFYERICKKLPDKRITNSSYGTIKELKVNIASCDAFVGSRYHSTLFAFQSGVPFIGFSYDSKTVNFMKWADLEELCIEVSSIKPTDIIDKWSLLANSIALYRAKIAEKRKYFVKAARGHIDVVESFIDLSLQMRKKGIK